mmetsp:Transcript_10313/g.30211  ORF Transcript_10313/g.30211 Transcript_10313/m.30211 type:complete len:206 (-) Transcript_10313:59-676(-)
MQASAVAGARAFAGCARCDTDPAPSPLVPSRPVARPPPFAHGAHHADTCPDSPLSTAYVYRRTPLGLPDALEALLLGICCFCGGALVFCSAFFAACLALLRSLISRSAASRAAARTSGFWLRFALMTSRVMPTTALFVVLLTLRVCGHRCQSAGQPRAADGPSRGSATAKGTPRARRGRGAKRAAATALQQVRPPARPGTTRAAV